MALIIDEEEWPISFNETNDTRINYSEPESFNFIVLFTLVYSIIFTSGIFGNISTCIVIGRRLSMHTSTNFYLFSLTISDLLLIFGLPLKIYRLWNPSVYPLGKLLCITVGLISETLAIANVLTIAAFTVERYIAICRPFRVVTSVLFKLSRVVRYIISIWICALSFAMPQAVQFEVVTYVENGQEVISCMVKGHGVQQVSIISNFILFVFTMFLIIILYVLICVKLKMSHVMHPINISLVQNVKRLKVAPSYKSGATQKENIRMLVAVALSFFFCWAPFQVQRLLVIYGNNSENPADIFYKINIVLTRMSDVMYFFSASIKPILYNIISTKFRDAFKEILSLLCCRRERSSLQRTNSPCLESPTQLADAIVLQSPYNTRVQRCLSGDSSQLCVAPRQAQSPNQRDIAIVHEERLAKRTESLTSSQNISNSSLRDLDHELNCQELATYLYQVNSKITGNT